MSVELNLVENALTQGKVWKFWKVTAKSKVMKNCKMLWNLSIKSRLWVWIYSNQTEIEYFSPVIPNIRAIVKTHPSLLHNLLYFSPALPSLTIIFTRHPTPKPGEVLQYTYFWLIFKVCIIFNFRLILEHCSCYKREHGWFTGVCLCSLIIQKEGI